MSLRKGVAWQPAYVLHSWDWSESSLIVELFTRDRGRLVAAAKGAKRPHSGMRAVLLPFQRLSIQLGRAPADESAEVHLLRSAEWSGGPPMPAGAALFAAFYLNELVLKLLARQDPHPALFDAYAASIGALQAADDAQLQLTLRAFELVLLREVGVLPELGHVTLTLEPLRATQRYSLDAEAGVCSAASDEPGVSAEVLIGLEAALVAGDVGALSRRIQPAAGALRTPLRRMLHYHLASPSLRTRQVMADLQRLIDSEASRR